MKDKIKKFIEKIIDKSVKKVIQNQQKELINLSNKIVELEKTIVDIDNTTKSQTAAIIKSKKDIRKINSVLATSKTIKEIRENMK